MQSEDALRALLRRIDGRGYKAYSELRDGRFRVGEFELHVDAVQGDPFAAPSRVRLRAPHGAVGLPAALTRDALARCVFRDWLARRMRQALDATHPGGGRRGSGGSNRIAIDAGGQTVLERSAARLDGDVIELRLEVGLPAAGRRILGAEAAALLADRLPAAAETGLELDDAACRDALAFLGRVADQEAIRSALSERGLVAFVAEGAVLPRHSGVDDRPLTDAVPFRCETSLRVELELPGDRSVAGMGVPRGVTLIVGGGYHGKSTLLRALERAVYPHIPGDGREGVATDARALKLRAEDGRRVEGVAIDGFIRDLPLGRDTAVFRSDDASGSTSQAAGLVEALEAGARVLLMDEDTCATNFMTRDARMQALVAPEQEPITPLVDRVRELYDTHGVSTVLVAGSSGDFFDIADTVIEMRSFAARDRSGDAARVASADGVRRRGEAVAPLTPPPPRIPVLRSLDPARGETGRRPPRVAARGLHELRYGRSDLDLRGLEQLVDPSQTRAVGRALQWIATRGRAGASVAEHLDALDQLLDRDGVDALAAARAGRHPGNLARPRRFEIAGALNRLRTLQIDGTPAGLPEGERDET